MDTGFKNLATMAAGAVFVAVAVFVIYTTSDPEPSSSPEPRVHGPSRTPGDVETQPLPAEVASLDDLLVFARERARRWREDATTTRMYATKVTERGIFDREFSVVQVVFVSPAQSRGGTEANGWRFSVREGMYGGQEIWQHPAPEAGKEPGRWCALSDIVGPGAPASFTLDIRYATRASERPALLAFTKKPKRWMVVADPFSCEVRNRARQRTVEEERAAASAEAGGTWFDARGAVSRAQKVVAESRCRDEGTASGPGTVELTFRRDGLVERVEFLAGPYAGTPAGECLKKELSKLRISPWDRGAGRAAARFRW